MADKLTETVDPKLAAIIHSSMSGDFERREALVPAGKKRLFLDDERVPEDVTWITLHDGSYDVVRNFEEFKAYIGEHGMPSVISFDNDLGDGEPEGRDCVKWLVEQVLDGKLEMNPDFQFTVHSKNIVAAPWIQQYLDQFIAISK